MKEVVVVDLDGCLCSVNTFRFWLLFSFFYFLFSLHWILLSKFIRCVLLRIFGKTDRVQMKQDILKVTEHLPQYAINVFCGFLKIFVNRNVLSEMHKYDSACIVLCTAAPALYVEIFAEKFCFDRVFATPSVSDVGWRENIGCVKLENVRKFYGEDVVFNCVMTDHYDDLPLLLMANRCVLVRPSDTTLVKVAGKIDFEIL